MKKKLLKGVGTVLVAGMLFTSVTPCTRVYATETETAQEENSGDDVEITLDDKPYLALGSYGRPAA